MEGWSGLHELLSQTHQKVSRSKGTKEALMKAMGINSASSSQSSGKVRHPCVWPRRRKSTQTKIRGYSANSPGHFQNAPVLQIQSDLETVPEKKGGHKPRDLAKGNVGDAGKL